MKMLAHQNLHLFQNEIDNYYLTLHVAPRNAKKDYDWGSNRSVLLKLSTNEVMQMASVFLRIMHTLKIDKRENLTSWPRRIQKYKRYPKREGRFVVISRDSSSR